MIWLGLIGAVAAFVAGIVLGRRTVSPTGSPTPHSADVVAVDSARAEDEARAKAEADAQAQAKAALTMSDADVAKRIEQLRDKGRAGE